MPYKTGDLKGELTTPEIRKLIRAHNVLVSINIPKGATRSDIFKLLDDKGYMVNHVRQSIQRRYKSERKPNVTLEKAKEITKKKPVSEEDKKKRQQAKQKKKGQEAFLKVAIPAPPKPSKQSKGIKVGKPPPKPKKEEEPKKQKKAKKEVVLGKGVNYKKYPKSIWSSIQNSLKSYQDFDPASREGGMYSEEELIEFDKTVKKLEKNERWKLPFSKLTSLEMKTIKVVLESEALSMDPQNKEEDKRLATIKKVFPRLPDKK